MNEEKNKIEAILFTTGKFMNIDEISRLCGIASKGLIKDLLVKIKQDYEERNGALEILEENNKWKLNIRKQYNYLTTNLLSDTELDDSTTKTLALIAYKQPVLQSEIIKMRGNTAYDHIKILREQEFILAEKYGRTRMLKLTPKFYDYFDLVENELKSKLNQETSINEDGDDVET